MNLLLTSPGQPQPLTCMPSYQMFFFFFFGVPYLISLSIHRARQCQMEVSMNNQHAHWQSRTSHISTNWNMSVHDRSKYLIQSRSWSWFSVLINGCVFVELNMSARGCGGSSSSLPGTPVGEAGAANSVMSWAVSFEKLLEDPCGVSHFTVRHAQHMRSGIVQVLMSSNDVSGVPYMFIHSVCVFLHRPSWGLRWVRRTFYSGRLVKCSGRSQPPPWMR